MSIKNVRNKARQNLKGFCAVCPVCNGVACAGEVPGMGGVGTGSAFKDNVNDLAKVKLNLRTIHNAKNPDFSFDFLGHKLSIPIMAAPITGTEFNMGGALTDKEYLEDVIKGSLQSGSLPMIGDSADPNLYKIGVDTVKNSDGPGIAILKPKMNDKVIDSLKLLDKENFIAAGMDVDGAGLITMALNNSPVEPKSKEQLKEIISSTDLPFILKGIMTVDEAKAAIEVGADAIVVSNHGGRVLDHSQSSAKALYKISKAVKGKITILVDGGIRSGVDVFKMIALGADAVLIGRPLVTGSFGARDKGVSLILDTMKNELLQTMLLTGAESLSSINESMIDIEW